MDPTPTAAIAKGALARTASEAAASEPAQSNLPDFTPWQWRPQRPGAAAGGDPYSELYVVWPEKGKRAVKCRLCCKVVAQERSVYNFKVHLGWCHPYFLIGEDRSKPSYGGVREGSTRKHAREAPLSGGILKYTQQVTTVAKEVVARWLAEFCAEGGFSLRASDSPAVRNLLRRAMHGTRLPQRLPSRSMVTKAIDVMVAECATVAHARIKDAISTMDQFPGAIAVTSDTWTSRAAQGYLCTTIAYIDRDWRLQSEVVSCVPLPAPHTASALVDGITTAIPAPATMDHVVAIVTDGGSNFVAATNQLSGGRSMRCAAHTIQLALKDVAKVEPMAGILSAVMKVLARFSKSPARREALFRGAEQAGIKPLMPIYPVATRWDSNYYALHRFYQMRPALDLMTAREMGFSSLEEWKALWEPAARAPLAPLCRVLGVFAKWTRELQSAKRVTISLIPVAAKELFDATEPSADDHENIKTIKGQLRAGVASRIAPLASSPLVRLAQFVDPVQFVVAYRRGEDGQYTDEIKANLKATAVELGRFADERMRRGSNDGSSAGEGQIEWLQLGDEYQGWEAKRLFQAVGKYVDHDKTDAVNPLAWWRKRGSDLAPLDSVARWLLCIPATSAESERTFSLAGWLVSAVRSRLSGDRVNDLVLLRRRLASTSELRTTFAQGESTREDIEVIEQDKVEEVDEGDRMVELISEGTLAVNADGLLVPACDPKLLDATGSGDLSA
jgi:hypothetical protein